MRTVFLAVLVVLSGFAQAQLPGLSCSEEASLAPATPGRQSSIDFVNLSGHTARIYARNESRHRMLIGTMAPGQRFSQRALPGQPFVVTDTSDRCMALFQAQDGQPEARISAASPAATQSNQIIRTVAGTDWTFPGDGQPALNAPLGFPVSVAVDNAGNVYTADEANHMILRIGSDGIVHVVAGNGISGSSGDGGDARNASLGELISVAAAPDGSIYIALFGGVIRKVSPSGIISTIANLALTSGPGIGGQGQAIAVDPAGNVYFADFTGHQIRKIAPGGAISTVAGTGTAGNSGDGGPATSATLNRPMSVRFDAAGNLLIADANNRIIRKVDTKGIISTVPTKTPLTSPRAVDYDAAGNLYVLESSSNIIRKIALDGTVITVAGSGSAGFSGDGGTATRAQFNSPSGIALDGAGNIFVSDTNNGRVREVGLDSNISSIAGNGLYRLAPEGTQASVAFFRSLYGITLDTSGRVYIADRDAARVKRVELDGSLTTVAGNGQKVTSGKGPLPASSSISLPLSPAIDASGNLYFIESSMVRKVTPDGVMTTYAGGGTSNPGDGGAATSAILQLPQAIAIDAAGNLYISDDGSFRIRKVTTDGKISTIAGTGVSGLSGDGGPAAKAQVNYPLDLTVDPAGNVYFIDGFSKVRKIDTGGNISTIAGGGTKRGDGIPATDAQLFLEYGLALDAAGNLYVSDLTNVVHKISADGIIQTVAGTGRAGFSGDGGPPLSAMLNFPAGLATSPSGDLYLVDTSNYRVRVVTSTAPSFTLSPASFSFTVSADGAAPNAVPVALSSSITGLPYSVTTATQSGGNWLVTSATSQVMPSTLNVTVDPAGLQPATYRGTVTVTSAVGGVAPKVVAVTLVVQPEVQGVLSADAAGLTFSFVKGAAAGVKTLQVRGDGPFTVSAKTDSGGDWLSASPNQGNATAAVPTPITVSANPAGLIPGAYAGRVILKDSASTVTVPVTMTVSSSGQLMRLSKVGLTFSAVVGGGAVPSQSIAVLNRGQGAYPFSAQVISDPDVPSWLSIKPSSGVSDVSQPANLTVSVDPKGLTAGDYYARLEVSSSSADNSPQDATVVLHLLPAGTNAPPSVQPSGLVFTGVAGGGDPSSQTVLVSNLSAKPVTYGSSVATLDGGSYIAYQPVSATVPPGTFPVVVQPSFTGLKAGVYRGAMVFIFSDGTVQTVSILIVLAPAGTAGSNSAHIATAGGCKPTQLLPLITTLGSSFSVPAAFPTTITMQVVDDCGTPMTSGSAVTRFSNGDPPLTLNSIGDGDWTSTWVGGYSQTQVTITGTASTIQPQMSATVQITGGTNGNASGPAIVNGGVISASSFAKQTPLAPGSMVSIFGSALGNGTALAPSLPLSNTLAGTRMVVAGRAMPMLYSSSGQVNAVMPFGTPVNTPVQVIATNGKQISVPEEVSIAQAQPGVFTVNGSGTGQGHIYVSRPDFSQILAASATPAHAGDALVIYCSGLGPTDVPVEDGASSPVSPLARVANSVTVSIGGVATTPFFAGLAPGFAGLYQVNVIVPPGVSPGDQIPLVITVAGQSSPPVTLSAR
jgi:uncharacterized protein (TIGR03437 family)